MANYYPPQNNGPHTEIVGEINTTATSITVLDASVLPDAPNVITLGTDEDAELVLMQLKTGNILTVQRGFNGTTPGVWQDGTWAYRAITAQDISELQEQKPDTVDTVAPDAGTKNISLFRHVTQAEIDAMQADPSLMEPGVKYVVTEPQPGDFLALVRDALYPVGCIYMSVNAANPGTIFGGTWELVQAVRKQESGKASIVSSVNGTTSAAVDFTAGFIEVPTICLAVNTSIPDKRMAAYGAPTADGFQLFLNSTYGDVTTVVVSWIAVGEVVGYMFKRTA